MHSGFFPVVWGDKSWKNPSVLGCRFPGCSRKEVAGFGFVVMRKVVCGSSRFWIALSLMLLIGRASLLAQYTNGIYAEFNTSMGSFTCRLDYALAPKTTANFIGLATGQRSWLDLTTGITRTNPFYNGQIIHRVVTNFIIQGGSPNGQGTDGPGYTFQDEFHPSLRHDSFGTLSMANNGPDSNGSQFFLTVGNTSFLNDRHSVFGKLYGGSNVVYAISRVATNSASKPLTNITLHQVAIRRVGAAAQAFNITTNGLPVVTNLHLIATMSDSEISVTFSNRLNVDNRIYGSSNLVLWSGTKLGFETVPGFPSKFTVTPSGGSGFYRMSQIQYPPTLYTPRSMLNRNITLNFTSGLSGFLALAFDSSGFGFYNYNNVVANLILDYTYVQDAYRGRIYDLFANQLGWFDLHLAYTNSTSGTFKGTYYGASVVPVSGIFTNPP
jgi:peptidyl-prolyl cis-trans isomerase A (cyclophilin A)